MAATVRGPNGEPEPDEDGVASVLHSLIAPPGMAAADPALAGDDWPGVYAHAWQWLGALKIHPWVTPSPVAEPLPDTFTAVILGDWASGLYGAPVSAATAAVMMPSLLLHLGDVYYCGTPDEIDSRFLAFWPKVNGATSRALLGNHEMYSGGSGYFDRLLPALGQSSSCFAFANDHWLILGLDTGYKPTTAAVFLATPYDLYAGQIGWLNAMLAAYPTQRVVLCTHHQPFSHYERQAPELTRTLEPLLSTGRVAAWYWGHEHRCIVYDPHPRWGFRGRCVGHGGFPTRRDNPDAPAGWRALVSLADERGPVVVPSASEYDAPNPYVIGREREYQANGFAAVRFDGPTLLEVYVLPDGTPVGGSEVPRI